MEGIAVLLHQGHVPLPVQRQDRYAAWMEHHLPGRLFSIGQLGLIHQQGHDLSLKYPAALQRAFCQIHRNDLPLCAAWGRAHSRFAALFRCFLLQQPQLNLLYHISMPWVKQGGGKSLHRGGIFGRITKFFCLFLFFFSFIFLHFLSHPCIKLRFFSPQRRSVPKFERLSTCIFPAYGVQ